MIKQPRKYSVLVFASDSAPVTPDNDKKALPAVAADVAKKNAAKGKPPKG